MRRISWLSCVALAITLATSCSYAMRPVTFDASRADWERLAGEWRGQYTIGGRERHGLIEFRLKALEREASGDVLMIADRVVWPMTGMPPKDGFPRQPPPSQQLLTIRFVGAAGGEIRGNMEPYWDPDRHCRAWASFLGSVDGDVISGSFISVCDDGARVLSGRWRVERRRGANATPRDAIAQRGPLDVQ
jgi:hypothetical protein